MLIKGIDVIEVVFELTLFYLLFVMVSYVVKQYLLPAVRTEIQNIKQQEKDLKEKKRLLSDSKKRLETQVIDQEERLVLIEKKVQTWKTVLLNQKKQKETENKSILAHIKTKRAQQESHLNLLKLKEVVIPQAISLAYQKINELHGGENGLRILKELIFSVKTDNK